MIVAWSVCREHAGMCCCWWVQKKAEAMKKPGSQIEARQKALQVVCPICKVRRCNGTQAFHASAKKHCFLTVSSAAGDSTSAAVPLTGLIGV